ncbi:MAG: winged helix-turn-helix domain-containing protein [Rhodanobacteraceae bacterium]|nr:winged helix-turn-helix domain-containing protein [Rhodanobacteraceae bacterium]
MADTPKNTWPPATRQLQVGTLVVDLRYRRILRSDGEYELTQRCFDLLLLFLTEPATLHTREQIFRRIWPGVVVEDANLTTSIWMLRKALGPEAKEWVRTVAKQGYVFEPPTLVHPVHEVVQTLAASATDPQADDTPTTEPTPDKFVPAEPVPSVAAQVARASAPQRSWSGFGARLSVRAILSAIVLLASLFALVRWQADSHTVQPVTLVVSTDAALTDDARWPAELLQIWLEWKLGSSSNLAVTRGIDDGDSRKSQLVLIRVDQSAEQTGEWRINVRFHGPRTIPDITAASLPDRLPATLDAVSQQVYAALDGEKTEVDWPALELDPVTAEAFTAASRAEQQHRWSDAAQGFRRVVGKTPGFGYARLKLAESLAELGQQAAAEAEAASAAEWISRLPAQAKAPIAARVLAIDQHYSEAASAFAALARKEKGNTYAYSLIQAQNLRRAGRSGEALAVLREALPPSPTKLAPWLIERAAAEFASGDARRALANAEEAENLAKRLGWINERARALLTVALARSVLIRREKTDEALAQARRETADDAFAAAIREFEAAGDRLGGLRARLFAGIMRIPASLHIVHLDELLAEARAAGNAAVEIDALRHTAYFHYRAGDMGAYRQRIAEAAAVAGSVGNRLLRRQLETDLLHEDVLRADFDAADRRIAELRSEPAQGALAYWLGLFEAGLASRRGQYDQALSVLSETEQTLRGAAPDTLPALAAGLSCLRGAIALTQGRGGDARVAYAHCRSPTLLYYDLQAGIGEAELALHGGDPNMARHHLATVEQSIEKIPSFPDRWMLSIELAPLLARTGRIADARRLIQGVLPAVEQAGYRSLEVDARTTLAEVALAEGDQATARKELSSAMALSPTDDWVGRRRLRTVDALLDHLSGQTEAAAHTLGSLDSEARSHADVLAELLVHSVVQATSALPQCSSDRHDRLLAQSGLRGASERWMANIPEADAAVQLVQGQSFP